MSEPEAPVDQPYGGSEPRELAEHYRASRVCVCASTCEGGPRFTLEAMACGVPVVSTAVGIMPDLSSVARAAPKLMRRGH